ncbi:hypothetical protein C2845_PM09G03080 [Panicum miliaceum]|uniref:DUF295 domain-containing protein n=1 Tax=Panicum miliaceum TaxID=4540 RepID=A0A3L6S3D1_PANMI|nr:hypothetical protein C2845_PM09G03080 [Panicum miliaceum]
MAALSWSDLPPELLGLVLKCLPSLADRVRLRAVCHPWRSNAQQQSLPPLLPWLTLPDGAILSIPGGEIIRMPVHKGAHCCGSVDNWLFLVQTDGGCSLVNPFSGATVELPNLATVWNHDPSNATSGLNRILYKTVVLSPLDSSPDSLVAVLILGGGHCSTVCLWQPPIATDVPIARARWPLQVFDDVAFFNGKLHGLAPFNKLFVFDIDSELSDSPKISSIKCIISYSVGLPQSVSRTKVHIKKEYLVECCGRLLRVRRFLQSDRPGQAGRYLKHQRTVAFDVFEAGLSTNTHCWRKVNNLGGQVLFVGPHCSKSFPAVEYNRVQRDCIYFMCDYYPTLDPLRDSGVYDMRTGMITPLLSETVAVPQRHGGKWCPTWIFPADSTQLPLLSAFRLCSACLSVS